MEGKISIKEIGRIYVTDNEIEYQKQLNEVYNTENLFKKKNQVKNVEDIVENQVAMVEYKESLFKKFINKIKSIFHIL